jgi:hypothetical protein
MVRLSPERKARVEARVRELLQEMEQVTVVLDDQLVPDESTEGYHPPIL